MNELVSMKVVILRKSVMSDAISFQRGTDVPNKVQEDEENNGAIPGLVGRSCIQVHKDGNTNHARTRAEIPNHC